MGSRGQAWTLKSCTAAFPGSSVFLPPRGSCDEEEDRLGRCFHEVSVVLTVGLPSPAPRPVPCSQLRFPRLCYCVTDHIRGLDGWEDCHRQVLGITAGPIAVQT